MLHSGAKITGESIHTKKLDRIKRSGQLGITVVIGCSHTTAMLDRVTCSLPYNSPTATKKRTSHTFYCSVSHKNKTRSYTSDNCA